MTPKEKAEEVYKKHLFLLHEAEGFVVGTNLRPMVIKAPIASCEVAITAAWWSSPGLMHEPYLLSQKQFWEEVITKLKNLQ